MTIREVWAESPLLFFEGMDLQDGPNDFCKASWDTNRSCFFLPVLFPVV